MSNPPILESLQTNLNQKLMLQLWEIKTRNHKIVKTRKRMRFVAIFVKLQSY